MNFLFNAKNAKEGLAVKMKNQIIIVIRVFLVINVTRYWYVETQFGDI